jgi:hypothetical protein
MHGGDENLVDLDVYGRVILKWILEGVNWINLTQDRDRWQALVSAVMKHWVP